MHSFFTRISKTDQTARFDLRLSWAHMPKDKGSYFGYHRVRIMRARMVMSPTIVALINRPSI